MLSSFEHAQDSLRKCKDIELAMTNLEKQCSGDTCFPVAAGKRPPRSKPHFFSSDRPRKRNSTSKTSNKETESLSGQSSVSNLQQTSPSLLPLPHQIPSYQATPADSSIQGSALGSVRPEQCLTTQENRNKMASALSRPMKNQNGRVEEEEHRVIRSVHINGTCTALQVSLSHVYPFCETNPTPIVTSL